MALHRRLPARPGAPLAALFALGLAVAGCSSVTDPTAATVEGAEITAASIESELEAITSNEEYLAGVEQQFQVPSAGEGEGTYDTAFVARLLSLRVYYELVEQELDRQGESIGQDDLDAIRDETVQSVGGEEVFDGFPAAYRDRLVRQRALLAAIEQAFQGDVEEGAAQDVYDENPGDYEERCVSHILIGTEGGGAGDSTVEAGAEEAAAVAARLDAGEGFEEIASSAENDDTTAAAAAGSLGCITPQTPFDQTFLDAAYAAEVGEVTEPVQTQFGYHLILVTSAEQQPFEDVEEAIEQELAQANAGAFDEFLRRATCEGDIEVADRYGSWDTSTCEQGGIGQVSVPEGPTTTTTPVPDGSGLLEGGDLSDPAGDPSAGG